jgi:hypothetical protein
MPLRLTFLELRPPRSVGGKQEGPRCVVTLAPKTTFRIVMGERPS